MNGIFFSEIGEENMPRNHHDRTFRALAPIRKMQLQMVTSYLPKEVVDKLDLETIECYKASFTDSKLALHEADAVYKIAYKDSYRDKAEYCFSVFEQQTNLDPNVVPRIDLYSDLLKEEHYKNHKIRPIVHKVILYTGKSSHDKILMDKYDSYRHRKEEAKAAEIPILIDFNKLDEGLRDSSALAIMEFIYKHASDKDILDKLKSIKNELLALYNEEEDRACLKVMLQYVILSSVKAEKTAEGLIDIMNFIESNFPKEVKGDMLTAIDIIRNDAREEGIKKGKAEGEARGKIEGKAELLSELISQGIVSLDKVKDLLDSDPDLRKRNWFN